MGGHICPWWFAYTFDNRLRHFFHNPQKMLSPYVSKGITALDVGLARLVGSKGCVIAADIQPKMLEATQRRADKNGLSGIIRLHRSEPKSLGIDTPVDFILAFWMVHEVPDAELFFHQIRACLKSNGRFLVVEPKLHVSSKRFQETAALAQASGLIPCDTPSIKLSRSLIFKHKNDIFKP